MGSCGEPRSRQRRQPRSGPPEGRVLAKEAKLKQGILATGSHRIAVIRRDVGREELKGRAILHIAHAPVVANGRRKDAAHHGAAINDVPVKKQHGLGNIHRLVLRVNAVDGPIHRLREVIRVVHVHLGACGGLRRLPSRLDAHAQSLHHLRHALVRLAEKLAEKLVALLLVVLDEVATLPEGIARLTNGCGRRPSFALGMVPTTMPPLAILRPRVSTCQ